ncbi:cysteine hydrolase [Rubellimicrobium rubrum]|uniref:Cysteine hydrolase n=1 Tax=Rubellimicrobium rubrum TaxID=2585369 RepID=A0A5C4MUZ7_9RHOB|nr:cysteine hydrolase [Rubellimicrobium rubrum]TNC47617.1 cysteine hydrolase [Rubellimicrobium rubrum]
MPVQPTIVGNAVLVVIDIQKSAFMDDKAGIPIMPGYRANMERARGVVDAAHGAGIPVVFIQEIHRRDMVDYGRELDGTEDVHCMEGEPGTPPAFEEMGRLPGDYFIHKRRYSAFFGTELEILLKGLKAQTLILIGGLTDVCVHYTFADGHQNDYYCRVIADCVGGSSLAAHEASLRAMEYLQTGAVLTADQIMAELGGRSAAAA